MAKTNAERQKAYRERKKKIDPSFLSRERQRAKGYRKSADELSANEYKQRLQRNKIYCKTYRLKKAVGKIDENDNDIQISSFEQQQSSTPIATPSPSTSFKSTRQNTGGKLLVSLKFCQRKSSTTRKAKANSLSKVKQKITELRTKLKTEQRAKKRWQKKCQRLKGVFNKELSNKPRENESIHPEAETLTPKSKTLMELKAAGINPNKSKAHRSLFKKITLTNCIIGELRSSRTENRTVTIRKTIKSIASGRIMKKYRCLNILNKETGICRRNLTTDVSKVLTRQEIIRSTLEAKQTREDIRQFFSRDDVSRCMPGKRDATKVDGQKIQTRILNDYLHNLHDKFAAENPDRKVSYSFFCKLRPKNVKLTALLSRNTCLCTIHQNMALKLKSLRSYNVDISPNPEVVGRKVAYEEMKTKVDDLSSEEIEYEEWQRVEVDGKKRMRVVKKNKPLQEFKESMMAEFNKFLEHCSRVHDQYTALNTLKNNLPENRALIQMDFAENYTCQNTDEIQSAYWNATSVTIHPVVVYFKQNGTLKHKNLSFISDVNSHNTAAVFAIIDRLLPVVKDLLPTVEVIHYWTDSPSSQYRNRNVFHLRTKHQEMYGVAASWDFFEAGHGKSVCDGIGGACKRMASEAVKQGKVSIQDAKDFYQYAHDNEKSISYIFYTQCDYDKALEKIERMKAKAIPGTMKLHAVRFDKGRLLSRKTSCYCDVCMNEPCSTWTQHELHESAEMIDKDQPNVVPSYIKEGKYVVAMYDNDWYVGQVVETDESDKTAEITFMTKRTYKSKTQFNWPPTEDRLWVGFDSILMGIKDPMPADRFRRFYTLSSDDLDQIESF